MTTEEDSNDSNDADAQYIDRDEIPDDAIILQNREVLTDDDGVIGRIEPKDPEEVMEGDY